MNTRSLMNHGFKRMAANILSIFAILAIAFPVTGSAYAQDSAPKVGLVLNAFATQDNDFNWMAEQGLLRAETYLGISSQVYQPANQDEYNVVLQQCADANNLCIAVGFDYGVSLANAAKNNPDTEWGIVDYSYPDCWEGAVEGVDCGSLTELPNVRGLRFDEKQAGYLAGVLAGGMTNSKTIGAVGGMDIPPVVAFVEGYRNGAECTDPDVNTLITYTGTFTDPELGALTAQDMIEQGADVIFGAAGLTGNGAILYSALNGQWAIGVDTDQYLTVFENGTIPGSDKLLSSAMKRVDNAVYQTIEDYVNGEFTSGTVVYNLAMDGVGLAPFHATESSIPQEVKDRLEIVKQGIIDGMVNIDACPWLIAFPENEAVEGWEWPGGATVTLTINNAPGMEWSGTAEVTSWGDPRTYVRIEFGNDYDLQIGDEVTLTDEFGTITTHTVQNLSVTDVNGETDTVTGTANIGAVVQVWPHGYDQDYFIEYPVEDGTWVADFGALGFHTIEDTGGRSQIVVDGSATAVDWNVLTPPPTPWRDEFDGPLADGWYWVHENSDKWEFADGFLRIYTSPFATGDENLLLRPVAEGDFAIETRVLFEPNTNFQFAGMVIWQDEKNFLQLGRAFCDVEGACVGNGIYFDYIGGGSWQDGSFATPVDNPSEAYLRLERRGEMVRAFFSYEGVTWFEIGTHLIPPDFQVNGVGLTSAQDYNTPEWDIPADFDYFELTEGWGFLPEGFHDYDSGDVPSWACNAGGWAVDPDNREADIAVEVNVDGTSYSSNASEYREDLDSAGVCVDGKCGFSMSLWDTITSYEMHNITAYAQDIESGEWVRLSNSPKELTCRTYDIYAYDPLTGETKQITNSRDADEYNPSWSPNGKKVAHDVVAADESVSGVYVTDVKTGVSTKLADAGSNDAVWSPNGKWIAFDRARTETPHIYIIPATGGTPTLVKEYAMSADWAPNGKRLVFTNFDPEFGDWSVRTIAVDGGKGGETTVVSIGFNPAWSPDGNWIAYDFDGDIWKVQVDVHGTPLGDPIQMTSGPFWDGQPTWSPDSTTIVYHTGFNDDWDLWSVPAAGGTPTWLTGAVVFGDYDPAYARNSSNVAYASFSPNGQAARTWVAAFTYNAGTWNAGTHSYQFWIQGAPNGDEFSFEVSNGASPYDGYALIRPSNVLRAQTPDGCADISNIRPDQQTMFHVGWTFDGIYADALSHFENIMAQVRWDSWEPVDMTMHTIFPFTASVDWFGYTCTFTAP